MAILLQYYAKGIIYARSGQTAWQSFTSNLISWRWLLAIMTKYTGGELLQNIICCDYKRHQHSVESVGGSNQS